MTFPLKSPFAAHLVKHRQITKARSWLAVRLRRRDMSEFAEEVAKCLHRGNFA